MKKLLLVSVLFLSATVLFARGGSDPSPSPPPQPTVEKYVVVIYHTGAYGETTIHSWQPIAFDSYGNPMGWLSANPTVIVTPWYETIKEVDPYLGTSTTYTYHPQKNRIDYGTSQWWGYSPIYTEQRVVQVNYRVTKIRTR